MKTLKKTFAIIAIGAVIAMGMSACLSMSTSAELDEERLAAMENASWVVKALVYNPYAINDYFIECNKDEVAYFKSISLANRLDGNKWYALTAPEFPGTYYYIQKRPSGSMLLPDSFRVYKSTTIDEETFNQRNTLVSASWVVRVLDSQPSFNGFEQLSEIDSESYFVQNIMSREVGPDDAIYQKWYVLTAPELPDLTYYYYSNRRSSQSLYIGTSIFLYKRKQ